MSRLLLHFRNGILFEEASHESRIEVSTDFYDLASSESTNPAIAVVKLKPVPRRGKRMQLDYRPIGAYQGMLDTKLCAMREDLIELFEGVCAKVRLAVVVTG